MRVTAEQETRNMARTVTVPIRFMGSEAQRAANIASHEWHTVDPEEPAECGRCASRIYHAAAAYPCGTEPPRRTIVLEDQPS